MRLYTHTHTHTHTGSFRGYLEWNKKGKENIKTHVLYVVLSLGKLTKANLPNLKCTWKKACVFSAWESEVG